MTTRKQLPVFLRFIWTVLLILLFGASIAFYATPWKLLCLQALQFLALALPASMALDAGWSLARVAKAPHRTRDLLVGTSTIIASFLPFAAIATLIWFGRLPPGFWPWLLPLAVIILPFLITAAHRALLESQSGRALVMHVAVAVIAAGLTWLQIAMVHNLHTWFFVVIGILPIPLLGVTMLITLVASVFSTTVLISAGIFHPLRKVYGIR